MPIIQKHEIKRALNNIEAHSDTDVFPRSNDYNLIFSQASNREDLINKIQQIVASVDSFSEALKKSPPVNISAIYPSGYNGYRWVTKIDPLWNAVYLSIATALAKAAESERIEVERKKIFSHRFSAVRDSKDLFTPGGWGEFTSESRERAHDSKYVLIVDLADFYSRIYLHRLENEVERVSPDTGLSRMIDLLLTNFNTSRSFGIPIGGPASRVMSEILLNSADKFMDRHLGLNFVRYADDYRIFLDSVDEANHVTSKLSEYFFDNEGLALQKHKTRIMSSNDYLSSLDYSGAEIGSAQHFLGITLYYDPYSPNAEDDYERLRAALEDFDIIELLQAELSKGKADLSVVSKIARSLHAMPSSTKIQACRTMMENTQKLYPVLPKVLKAVQDAAKNAVEDDDVNTANELALIARTAVTQDRYVYDSEVCVAYIAKIIGCVQNAINEEALGFIYGLRFGASSEPSTLVQTEVMDTMAIWQVAHWLRAKKSRFGSLHPRLQEGFYRASYSLGEEGRHWREHNRDRLSAYRLPFVKRG